MEKPKEIQGIRKNGNISLAMIGEEYVIFHDYQRASDGTITSTHEYRTENTVEIATRYTEDIATRDRKAIITELEELKKRNEKSTLLTTK